MQKLDCCDVVSARASVRDCVLLRQRKQFAVTVIDTEFVEQLVGRCGAEYQIDALIRRCVVFSSNATATFALLDALDLENLLLRIIYVQVKPELRVVRAVIAVFEERVDLRILRCIRRIVCKIKTVRTFEVFCDVDLSKRNWAQRRRRRHMQPPTEASHS